MIRYLPPAAIYSPASARLVLWSRGVAVRCLWGLATDPGVGRSVDQPRLEAERASPFW